MSDVDFLVKDLPDPASARRFIDQFREKHKSEGAKLEANQTLLSDVLTLASYSPLLSTSLLQNPSYVSWLGRERLDAKVRGKEDLLESLARFSLTNSLAEQHVIYARFRRRELMRIFLSDIRRLSTIAEVTEDISNLADTILESALRHAKQELDNRYGPPLESDERGKKRPAEMCVVSLGKLGSKELNYSSDIDLLFMYSSEGTTAGTGAKGSLTNREYFIKLAETVVKLVGRQTGEGAAYRVDLRLRPHGRIGPLAMSVTDTVKYYRTEARIWERQVLIRSRASAGAPALYKQFFSKVEDIIFSKNETVENALTNVRASKQLIDKEARTSQGYDVKLGRGGIREIEFIAQALQLAYGGRDKWLRASHTLISLSRLSDRGYITDHELSDLSEAYKFLRRLEHILQMEHGLQTHLLPDDQEVRTTIARRMGYVDADQFALDLTGHLGRVSSAFARLFDHIGSSSEPMQPEALAGESDFEHPLELGVTSSLNTLAPASWKYSDALHDDRFFVKRLGEVLTASRYAKRLGMLRQQWRQHHEAIKVWDRSKAIDVATSKDLQTMLAEASIEVALAIARDELAKRFKAPIETFPLAVLALGKLGSANIDYGSDLDILLVYGESPGVPAGPSHAEFYSRAAEIFVTTLSGVTREGSLYRVDLRLRPHGKNGPSVVSRSALVEYLANDAAAWELLAYVKLRGVYSSESGLAHDIAAECTAAILARGISIPAEELTSQTYNIRLRLERERQKLRRTGEIDIKYGSGGMLDIYFTIRFLQLRGSIADRDGERTSDKTLKRLLEKDLLSTEDYRKLSGGYEFLSALDHYLRLYIGRTTRIPTANPSALKMIAGRMNIRTLEELLGELTIHRINIRQAFENVLSMRPIGRL